MEGNLTLETSNYMTDLEIITIDEWSTFRAVTAGVASYSFQNDHMTEECTMYTLF